MPSPTHAALRALNDARSDLSSMKPDVQVLIDHATGRISHRYLHGLCPDEISGPDARDPQCRVCQAIARLEGKPLTR